MHDECYGEYVRKIKKKEENNNDKKKKKKKKKKCCPVSQFGGQGVLEMLGH